MQYAISPPTEGETCSESVNTDTEDSHRSHVIPASMMTPSCTPLISKTRRGHVRTRGNGHPGMARSRAKQKANTAMIVMSTEYHPPLKHTALLHKVAESAPRYPDHKPAMKISRSRCSPQKLSLSPFLALNGCATISSDSGAMWALLLSKHQNKTFYFH